MLAAESIVRPDGTGDDSHTGSFFYQMKEWEYFGIPKPSREGMTLRGRRDPSVLDLLKRSWRRAQVQAEEEIAKGTPEVRSPGFPGGEFWVCRDEANRWVLLMEEWQHDNLDVLKAHYDWLAAALAKLRRDDSPGAYDISISRLCEETLILRFLAGDDNAMQDYEKLFQSSLEVGEAPIEVMKAQPEVTGMDRLARQAFLGGKAPLSLVNKPWTLYDSREYLVDYLFSTEPSPLLVLPSYRRALIEALQTQTQQGTLVVTQEGATLTYLAGDHVGGPGSESQLSKDAALPGNQPIGTTHDVRLCDLIAYFLTPKRGSGVWVSPAYHLDAPLAERDRAIADWIQVLGGKDAR